MASPPSPSIEQLSFQVSGLCYQLSTYLSSLEPQAVSTDPWAQAPETTKDNRSQLLNALTTLRHTVLGPSDHLREMATEWYSPAALRWILHFSIADHVPPTDSISYPSLSSAAGVPESQLKRILRFAMTNSLFAEPSPGNVAHTALSLGLRKDNPLHDYLAHCLEFSMPVATKMVEATERYGDTDAKDKTAFNVAFDTELPMFAWLKAQPEHAARFGRLMGAMHKSPGYDVRHLVEGYPWAELPEGARVVDVGGGLGHCSIALANAYPGLTCTVQDLEYVIKDAVVPEDLKGRVEAQAHDFFEPEPVKGADVYLLRQVLHDWPDESAVKILKGIVPAMQEGKSKIVVMDQVVPAPGQLPKMEEKTARTVDLVVMSHFNGKQRGIEDWEEIFKQIDGGLKWNVRRPKGSVFAIIELTQSAEGKVDNGHSEKVVNGSAEEGVKTNGVHS